MTQLLPFFIVLFAGLFLSKVFNRLHLPWVVALIVAGIIIGPNGFDLFTPNDTISFIGEIGLVFLMFIAGLETRLDSLKRSHGNVVFIALINGFVPAVGGFLVAQAFGYGVLPALLLAIVFISSSIAVVIPSLEGAGILHTRIGQTVIATTMIQDVLSLIFLSVLFQQIDPITALPLPLFYIILFVSLFVLRYVLIKLRWYFSKSGSKARDIFETEIRSIFAILIGTVIIFELLGLHPVIAGFFAGFVLSDSITSEALKEKLKALSYGIFIPVFFVVVGTTTNFSIFSNTESLLFVAAVVGVSFILKLSSGWLGGRIFGYTKRQSILLGITSTPQLSTTLAVAFTAQQLGLFDDLFVNAIIALTLITSLLTPFLISKYSQKVA